MIGLVGQARAPNTAHRRRVVKVVTPTMKLWDHGSLGVMVVKEGKCTVASARLHQLPHGWLLRAHGFCWTHPRARLPKGEGGVVPNLMVVRTKKQARRILRQLVEGVVA